MTNDAKQIADAVGFEIAKEILLEYESTISDAEVAEIWAQCNDNPWNAVPLYRILEIAKGMK